MREDLCGRSMRGDGQVEEPVVSYVFGKMIMAGSPGFADCKLQSE